MSSIFSTPLAGIDGQMRFKILTYTLAVMVLAEGGYIILHRHPISRFKPVEENGYVAFDTATGQLCRTYRMKSSPKRASAVVPPDRVPKNLPGTPFLMRLETRRLVSKKERMPK